MSPTSVRPDAAPPSPITGRLAAGRLGTGSLVAFALCAATPLTVVAGVTTTAFALTGEIGLPVAFIVIALVLAVFAIGFTRMAAAIPNAGAFYAFVATGLSPAVGVGAAWIAWAAYTALSLGLYGLVGVAAPPLLEQFFGISAPWWTVAGVCWILVTVLGTRAVDLAGRILIVLLAAEAAIIIVAAAAALAHPAGGEVSFAALNPIDFANGTGPGALLALAVLACIGFEAPAVYAEESRQAHRTVRRATFWTLGVLMALYAPAAWSLTVAVGPDQIVEASREQGLGVYFGLIAAQLGESVATTANVLLVTSTVAAAISFHSTTSRYVFALGREHVLPRSLGRAWPRTGAPARASLTQSVIVGSIVLAFAVTGADPLVDLFYTMGTSGGYAVLILLVLTSLAVCTFTARHRREHQEGGGLVAPVIAAVLLTGVAVLATIDFADLLGAPAGSALSWAIPVAIGAIGVLGTIWGIVLFVTRPDIYIRIGAGPAADRPSPRVGSWV